MECIHLLQRVEIFLKDDLQKEKLSEHVSQKLLELQCIIQNFLGKTDSYKKKEIEDSKRRSQQPLPPIPNRKTENNIPIDDEIYEDICNESIYVEANPVESFVSKQEQKPKMKLLKKTLSERFIFADRGRRKSNLSLVNESLCKIPPDFTTHLRVWSNDKWSKKVCSIRGNHLLVQSKSKKNDTVVNLDGCELSPDVDSHGNKNQYVFLLTRENEEIIKLKAPSGEELGKWVMAITKAQTKSLAKPKDENCDLTDENELYVGMCQESSTNEQASEDENIYIAFDPVLERSRPSTSTKSEPRSFAKADSEPSINKSRSFTLSDTRRMSSKKSKSFEVSESEAEEIKEKIEEVDKFIHMSRIKEAQLLRYFDASVEQKNFMTTSEVDNIISLTRQNISNLKSQKDFLRRKLTGEVAIGESFRRNPMPIDPKVLEKRRDLFDRNNIKNKNYRKNDRLHSSARKIVGVGNVQSLKSKFEQLE